MIDKKDDNKIKINRKPTFWLLVLISLILGGVLGALIGQQALMKYHEYLNTEAKAQKIVYSINKNKIITVPAAPKLTEKIQKLIIPEKPVVITPVHNNAITKKQANNSLAATNENPVILHSTKNQPSIAIIICNVGLNSSLSNLLLKLPPQIIIGFSPYGQNLNELSKKFFDLKHDIIINIPLEPSNYPLDNPGPYALMTGLTVQENIARLNNLAKMVDYTIGFYTLGDERFTYDIDSNMPILSEIKKQNLYYVYGGGHENNVINQAAAMASFPLIVSDLILDSDISEDIINDNLAKLEQLAMKRGSAIAIAHPYPMTIKIIEKWITTLEAKKIALVGLQEINKLLQK